MSDVVLYPPMPQPDELTKFFWDAVEQHRLLIQRCDNCGAYAHPPKHICRVCLCTSLSPTPVSGKATLVTWTQPAQPFDTYFRSKLPYVLAVVNLVEQDPLRFVSNLVDFDESLLRIDLPLDVSFREVAPGCSLPLFTPATEESWRS